MSYIEFKNVSKTYQMGEVEIKALDKVSFDIDKGELVVILGPSGCGKSTFLRCLKMLEMPTSGKVYLDNIGPVIELSNNNSKNVFGNAVIPIKVSDIHSGVESNSFTKEDILVSVGGNILTSGISLERVNDNNYNLNHLFFL